MNNKPRKIVAGIILAAVGAIVVRAACTCVFPGLLYNTSSKRVLVEGDGRDCKKEFYAIIPRDGNSWASHDDADTAYPDSIISADGYGVWKSPWELQVIDIPGMSAVSLAGSTNVYDAQCPSVIKAGRICQGFTSYGTGMGTPYWKHVWEIKYGPPGGVPTGGQWAVFQASDSTFVSLANPTKNYSTSEYIELKAGTTVAPIDQRVIYIKFPLSAIASSSYDVTAAYLTLKIMWHGKGTNYGAGTVDQPDKVSYDTSTGQAKPWPLLGTVFGASNAWNASTITWSSGRPSVNSTPEGTFTLTPNYAGGFTPQFTASDYDTGIRVGVDVTNQVRAAKSTGAVSFVIYVNGTTTVDFKSINYASVMSSYPGARPHLNVLWSVPTN